MLAADGFGCQLLYIRIFCLNSDPRIDKENRFRWNEAGCYPIGMFNGWNEFCSARFVLH